MGKGSQSASSSDVVTTAPRAQGRVYGERARVGLVVPSTNTVAEIECWRLAPTGVSVHTSRMPFLPKRSSQPLEAMETHVPRVLEEAASAEPDVIAYGCTASSAKGDPRAYQTKLEAMTGLATVTAAGALLGALAALEAKRIVLLTPYPPAVNAHECQFFARHGIEVSGEESVIVDPAQHQMRYMSRVPPDLLAARALALAARHQPDAVVLSCCDLASLDAIAAIERDAGTPVISSTQALFWQALRHAGIVEPLEGGGRLLLEH